MDGSSPPWHLWCSEPYACPVWESATPRDAGSRPGSAKPRGNFDQAMTRDGATTRGRHQEREKVRRGARGQEEQKISLDHHTSVVGLAVGKPWDRGKNGFVDIRWRSR